MQNVPAKRPQKQIQTEPPAWVASNLPNPSNQRDPVKRAETVGRKGLDEG